jgi:AbrB family looped-hinge helix DNA binding protein
MGIQVKVLQKGKITIPVEVRGALGIREGDTLTLEVRSGRILLLPQRTVLNPTEVLDGLLEGLSVKEPIKEGLKETAAARITRKLGRSLE